MNPIVLATLCGFGFGAVAVMLMLPMSFPDKRRALAAAFASRFAVGFLVPLSLLPLPGPIAGGLIGLLISLPDAIVTKSYAPILGVGLLGGALIGWFGPHIAT